METWTANPPFDFFRFLSACWFMVAYDDLKRQMAETERRGVAIQQRWAAAGLGLAGQALGPTPTTPLFCPDTGPNWFDH